MSQSLKVSVVITTKNRKEELRVALQSAFIQTARPEVIVIDDGSTDGTSEVVREEFSQTKLHRSEQSRGLIVQRNEAARLASGDIIVSIDDDAAFATPEVVAQTIADFDSPRIGAVAIPYIEPRRGNRVMQKAPSRAETWVADSFIGTAHAVRRDCFVRLGGYREHLVHQGEESDYCIRLLNCGLVVRLGSGDVIHHFESPKRDFRRMDYYGTRNLVLFAWQNVPYPFLPFHLAATTARCVVHTLKPARLRTRLGSVFDAYCQMPAVRREPVSALTYRLSRRLKKGGPLPLSEIESYLPPVELDF